MHKLVSRTKGKPVSRLFPQFQVPCDFYNVDAIRELLRKHSLNVSINFLKCTKEKLTTGRCYTLEELHNFQGYAYLYRLDNNGIYFYVKDFDYNTLITFTDDDVKAFSEPVKLDALSNPDTVYVLYGAWCEANCELVDVIGVSKDLEKLQDILNVIRLTRASDYLVESYGVQKEEYSDDYYEFWDKRGNYARFYIDEREME